MGTEKSPSLSASLFKATLHRKVSRESRVGESTANRDVGCGVGRAWVLLICSLQPGAFQQGTGVVMDSTICGFTPSAAPQCRALTPGAVGMVGARAPPPARSHSVGWRHGAPAPKIPPLSGLSHTQSVLSSFPDPAVVVGVIRAGRPRAEPQEMQSRPCLPCRCHRDRRKSGTGRGQEPPGGCQELSQHQSGRGEETLSSVPG